MGFLIAVGVTGGIIFLIGGFRIPSWESVVPEIYFAGGFVGLIIGLTLLIFIILFWNGFEASYRVDISGIYQSIGGMSTKVHRATVLLGVLFHSSSAAGAGLLAQGGEERSITWKEARRIKVDTKKRYIYISRAFLGIYPIDMFCTEKNFEEVLTFFKTHLPKTTPFIIPSE